MNRPVLEVRDLHVRFPTRAGPVRAVDGLDLAVDAGRTLGVVGESGSGKSAMANALLGLHEGTSAQVHGEVRVAGTDLLSASPDAVRSLRGREVALVPQDPLSALHPHLTVGEQVAEAYRVHQPQASRREARARAIDMLGRVGVPLPARRYGEHPHQLSGGMRQRVLIAMALVAEPTVLVADEPTTALDVTVQAEILALVADLQAELGTAVVLITHDLGVVAEVADDVLVMYAGRAVERGSAGDVLLRPAMPYTWGLLGSAPRPDLGGGAGERLVPVPGAPPSAVDPPTGCSFHPRCGVREHALGGPRRCSVDRPDLEPVGSPAASHVAACHVPVQVRAELRREAAHGSLGRTEAEVE